MLNDYEEFTESQRKIVETFVTNTDSSVFALRNLPEVIKGALFSRYSRSSLGLRSLLLKDFILNEDTAFANITGAKPETEGDSEDNSQEGSSEDQIVAIRRAQNFYDRILDGYGDDSIGELGGAHLAVENISMIGAKVIEDCRLGGSPLEKSTRYIYFDQKVKGEYLFYREPILMTSAFRDIYIKMCNDLFDSYRKLIAPMTELMEKKFPKEHDVSKVAYTAALRAKVLDCLRGLLPSSALTNMGVYGNGRFFENLIQKLNAHSLSEMQEIGRSSYQELSKVIPSFIRRGDTSHKYYKSFQAFKEKMQSEVDLLSQQYTKSLSKSGRAEVRLVGYSEDAAKKIAAATIFPSSGCSLSDLIDHCNKLPEEDINRILESISGFRENRRHKSPRSLEHATFTFEIVADFGIYRDLQRHRTLTQDRQNLSCDFGYYVPSEIIGTEMEKEYRDVLDRSKEVYDTIYSELPEEAQYVVPMAYNMRWYFHVNLRALQWICELRSSPAGHPNYRFVAQEMAKQVSDALPELERFFKFVDFDGYELGRLGQEIRTEEKVKARQS